MFRKFSTASKPIYSVKEYINQSKEHVNRELDMQSYAIKVITGMMMSGFAAMYLQVDKRFEQVDKRFEHLESEVKDIKKEVKEIKSTLNDILLAVTPSKKD